MSPLSYPRFPRNQLRCPGKAVDYALAHRNHKIREISPVEAEADEMGLSAAEVRKANKAAEMSSAVAIVEKVGWEVKWEWE